jgi:D-alanine transfer protein
MIFGPVFVAIAILIGVVLLAPARTSHRLSDEKSAATDLTPIIFKNAALKKEALSDPDHRFVPFFGSSEWRRFDELHPSILSEAYQRSYTPFLLGVQGAESLSHYFGMQQIEPELQNKQAVFFISPQWFVKEGQAPNAFKFYFSNDQAYRFLENAQNTATDRYAAKRFLKMNPESSVSQFMKKIANGKALSTIDKWRIKTLKNWAIHEDNLFAGLQFGDNYQEKVAPRAKKLPQPYNPVTLYQRAIELGQANTSNNPFEILNSFYTSRIKPTLPKLKNSQRHFSYLQSPEYNDFQLVLNEFAKNKTDVIFVIPPVNANWQAYTGLNQKMYEETVQKIRYQLTSQGFNHIADLSQNGDQPYFMQDTIHLGWTGWLAFDREVNTFLTTKQTPPTYQLNDYFLTAEWANKKQVTQ